MEIKRKVEKSFEKIEFFNSKGSYEFLKLTHHLNNREFHLSKATNCFKFETTSIIIKGTQTHKELDFNKDDEYEIKNETDAFFIKGKDIFINNIGYSEDKLKIISGSIYSLSDARASEKKGSLYRRFIMPLNSEKSGLHDFQKFEVQISRDKRKYLGFYLPVTINGNLYYLYEYKHNESSYLLIDSSIKLIEKDFQKICFNILLALAFIKGNLFHDESYVLGFNEEEMEDPNELTYYSMGVSVKTDQPVFTTNMYLIYRDQFDELETEEEQELWKKNHYSDVYDFGKEPFSKLAELFCNQEKAQRAAILFIHGHKSSLEIRLPNYYVALEAITSLISSTLKETKQRLNPIKDNSVANEIVLLTIKNIKKYIKENDLGPDDVDIEIIRRKLDSLNSPPNADKLAEPYERFGYTLSDEQFKILKQRNSYLHGSFVKYIDDDEAFKEALYVGLRVHFLIAVLVLKMVGFSGKIINYPSWWEYMTDKKTGEDRLVKI